VTNLIQELSIDLALSRGEIEAILRSAPARYKIFQIPKRRGGVRVIAQPARELKDIQRIIVERYLSVLPVHPTATAYVEGKSILTNASLHKNANVLLKLDFEDFFLSIRPIDLRRAVEKTEPKLLRSSDWAWIENALFWKNPHTGKRCLAIGAPSSPLISNAVMYDFDKIASHFVRRRRVVYSRYADDITLSGQTIESLTKVHAYLRKLLSQRAYPRLKFNTEKSGIYTKGMRRMVTGLIITPSGEISIGRARKRLISAMVHKYLTDEDRSVEHVNRLKGWLAFCNSVERGYLESLRRKYGAIVDQLLAAPSMPRPQFSDQKLFI
jgi:RNA-directed DNA polymerase